jgi:hypothetical protein
VQPDDSIDEGRRSLPCGEQLAGYRVDHAEPNVQCMLLHEAHVSFGDKAPLRALLLLPGLLAQLCVCSRGPANAVWQCYPRLKHSYA